MSAPRLFVCSDFLERVHSSMCHICLQPKGAHPTDNDSGYWAEWLVSEMSLDEPGDDATRDMIEVGGRLFPADWDSDAIEAELDLLEHDYRGESVDDLEDDGSRSNA